MKSKLVAAAAALAMAACGGGGGGGDAGVSAQGFWNGDDFSALITPSGEVWAVEDYGADGLLLYRGSITPSSGNNVSGSLQAYFADGPISGTVSAAVVPRATLSGTVTPQGYSPITFSATYSNSYDQPARLDSLTGNWTIDGGFITFNAQGSFSAVQDGCQTSGQVTPDNSGKNFFRVTASFGSGCSLQGQTATGVLVVDGQLMVVGLVAGGTGGALIGQRQ